jgi:hypothetical protein
MSVLSKAVELLEIVVTDYHEGEDDTYRYSIIDEIESWLHWYRNGTQDNDLYNDITEVLKGHTQKLVCGETTDDIIFIETPADYKAISVEIGMLLQTYIDVYIERMKQEAADYRNELKDNNK